MLLSTVECLGLRRVVAVVHRGGFAARVAVFFLGKFGSAEILVIGQAQTTKTGTWPKNLFNKGGGIWPQPSLS
jgi:hypothetical protein